MLCGQVLDEIETAVNALDPAAGMRTPERAGSAVQRVGSASLRTVTEISENAEPSVEQPAAAVPTTASDFDYDSLYD